MRKFNQGDKAIHDKFDLGSGTVKKLKQYPFVTFLPDVQEKVTPKGNGFLFERTGICEISEENLKPIN